MEEIKASGLQVLAIGIGQPSHAEFFCSRLAPGITCLTSETITLHRRYGIGYGESKNYISTKFAGSVARAVMQGYMQGIPTTGPEGYGLLTANFVVDRSGVIRYAHYARIVGDHPDFEEILQVGRSIG
jgi:peroxiredoxin